MALGAILILGSALLLPRLGTQSLWLDEGLTVDPALTATGLDDLLKRVQAEDTQPPASHFVLYALRGAFPHSEFFLRLPSFVEIEFGLILLYLVVARLWGARTALLTVALAQFSSFLAFHAADARGYGLWFLLAGASWWAMLRWYDSGARLGPALVWAVINGLGLWTHLFHVFLMIGQLAVVAAIVVAGRGRRVPARHLTKAVLTQLIASTLLLPLLALLLQKIAAGKPAGVGWTRPFSWGNLAYYLYAFVFGSSFGPNLHDLHAKSFSVVVGEQWPALAIAGLALATVGVLYVLLLRDAARRPDRRWELLVLVVFPAASLAGPFIYSAVSEFPLHPRHLLFVWPLVPLTLALALLRAERFRFAVAAVIALQAIAFGNLLFNPYYWKDDERGAVQFAEAHSRPNAYVLGDVAPYYCGQELGRKKNFIDFGEDTQEVWFIDNREWEPTNQRDRERLAERLASMGLREDGTYRQFRGIVLRHWTAKAP